MVEKHGLTEEQIQKLSEAFAKAFQPAIESIENFKEALTGAVRPPKNLFADEQLQEQIKITIDECEKATDKIVENGWFVASSYSLDFDDIIKIQNYSHNELNDFFLKYYTENNEEKIEVLLKSLQAHISNSSADKRLMNLLEECIICYNNEIYKVAIISLFSLIEGLICELFLKVEVERIVKKIFFKAMRDSINERNFMLGFVYLSVYKYLRKAFKDADFNGPEPKVVLNRNWMLHGKSDYDINKLDIVKMLSIVDTILDLA